MILSKNFDAILEIFCKTCNGIERDLEKFSQLVFRKKYYKTVKNKVVEVFEEFF